MTTDIHAGKILILDFGSQYTQLIARRVREIGVYSEVRSFDSSEAEIHAFAPRGIILSGGPESVMEAGSPRAPDCVFGLGVPVLGICYGMQAMAVQFGGRVEGGQSSEFGYARIRLLEENRLLHDIRDHVDEQGDTYLDVWMSHGDKVVELPVGFLAVAMTDGYSAYVAFEKMREAVVLAHCWSHARRKVLEAVERGSAEPAAATFRVRATDTRGGARVLLEETVPFFADPAPVEADLSALAGEIVRLDFELEAGDGSAEPVLGAWVRAGLDAGPGDGPGGGDGAAGERDAVVEALRAELAGRPVVAVLLDASNPSFMSCYGGRAGLTPNLDRLAEEGVRFDSAWSHASYTISSVSSLLSSTYTWEHGAWQEGTAVLESAPSWPERFADAGYRTVGIVHSPNGSSLFGLDRGFDTYVEVFRRVRPEKRIPTADDVLPVLDEVLADGDDRPLFLWLHIIEPHEPYQPPEPWAGRLDPEFEGEITGDADTLWAIRKWQLVPTERELEHLKREYEENFAFVDDVMGDVRSKLEAAGVFDDAVCVLFSDHGEGFLEHQGEIFSGMGHGSTVYEEMVRIPLIFRLPRGLAAEGAATDALASTVDILPTVADLVGVDPGEGPVRGRSLAPVLVDPARSVREWMIAHSATFDSERFLPSLGIRTADHKYVHSSGEANELFDLARDPGERENRLEAAPVVAGYLRQLLREGSGLDLDAGGLAGGRSGGGSISAEDRAALRALGYVDPDGE